MGCCTTVRKKYTDNQEENIYRDVLDGFPRIRHADFLEDLEKTKLNTELEDEYKFSEILYGKLRLSLVEQCKFNKEITIELAPKWGQAWNLVFKEDFPSNLIIWELLFNADQSDIKFQIIEELSILQAEELDLRFYKNLIKKIITLSIVTLNKMYLNGFSKFKLDVDTINNVVINIDFLKNTKNIYTKITHQENLQKFISQIEDFIDSIYMKHNNLNEAPENMNGPFTREMFYEFYRNFKFLFKPLELRCLYYDFVFHNVSLKKMVDEDEGGEKRESVKEEVDYNVEEVGGE